MTNKKIAIITAKFNHEITSQLRDGCVNELKHKNKEFDTFACPGAVELVPLANQIYNLNKYDAIILIGAVIKGDTDHYEYVCNLVTQSFANLSAKANIPVVFGVLTTQTEELAEERSNPNKMNKGKEFAECAIEMITNFQDIKA